MTHTPSEPTLRHVTREESRQARRLVARLRSTANAYHRRQIDHGELGQRNRKVWDRAEALHVTSLVSAILRGDCRPDVVTVHVSRTAMIGGGTSYRVYWPTTAKPSHPISARTYATVICTQDASGKHRGEYFETANAIDAKPRWSMPCGWEKLESRNRLERIAERLEARIAARVFPELQGRRRLSTLWETWSLPSDWKTVRVRITLPE